MKIDVRHIAKLARLRLEEDKISVFETQMQDIANMVENLPAIDSDLRALDEEDAMTLRADVIQKSLSRDEVLANAPEKQAGCIVVPKTV